MFLARGTHATPRHQLQEYLTNSPTLHEPIRKTSRRAVQGPKIYFNILSGEAQSRIELSLRGELAQTCHKRPACTNPQRLSARCRCPPRLSEIPKGRDHRIGKRSGRPNRGPTSCEYTPPSASSIANRKHSEVRRQSLRSM
jgi:hypothetical protein